MEKENGSETTSDMWLEWSTNPITEHLKKTLEHRVKALAVEVQVGLAKADTPEAVLRIQGGALAEATYALGLFRPRKASEK